MADRWDGQIRAAQARQRRLMAMASDPCPQCGACSEEFKAACIHAEKCALRADNPDD